MFVRVSFAIGAGVMMAANALLTAPSGVAQDLRPVDRAEASIARTESTYRAWLSLDLSRARAQADAVSSSSPGSALRELNGLVVAVKDNIDTDWLPTTAGSNALRNRRPMRNATVVDLVLAAGGVIPGKTNMDTFARGVRTFSEIGGQTLNAIDPSKSPGGSSGGTAVAVALGNADVGIGTDTCGSLRYPAAYNGIYGLRTTPGLVSRSGLIPLSPTHDVVGPMARNPEDLARLLDVIASPDDRDPTSLRAPTKTTSYVDIVRSSSTKASSFRIGVLRDRGAFRTQSGGTSSLDILRRAGFVLVDVKLPALGLPNVINEEFGLLKPRILNGTLTESSWINGVSIRQRAYQSKVDQITKDAHRLIEFMDANNLDALTYPTTPFLAASFGAAQPSSNCSLSASTGTPAIALPHPDAPVPGIDILGRPFTEDVLLQIGNRYELFRATR